MGRKAKKRRCGAALSGATPAAAGVMACVLILSAAGCGGGSGHSSSLTVPVQRHEWKFGKLTGERLATRHYNIFTTSSNRGLVAYLPGFMESAHDNYLLLTGLAQRPDAGEPMPIYLLASREQWDVLTERVLGPNAKHRQIEAGGYCHRGVCVLWDLGHFATFSIAAHEGCHQFLHHRLRDGLPAWAEEGLAVLSEGFELASDSVRFAPGENTGRQLDLRRAISSRRWLGMKRLLSTDAGDHMGGDLNVAPEYYGQLWALLLFIRSDERYRAALGRMIADAEAGRLRAALNVPAAMGSGRTYVRATGVPVFKHYIDTDLPAFEKRFLAYARKLAKLE